MSVWCPHTTRILQRLNCGPVNGASAVCFSPNGKLIAVAVQVKPNKKDIKKVEKRKFKNISLTTLHLSPSPSSFIPYLYHPLSPLLTSLPLSFLHISLSFPRLVFTFPLLLSPALIKSPFMHSLFFPYRMKITQ